MFLFDLNGGRAMVTGLVKIAWGKRKDEETRATLGRGSQMGIWAVSEKFLSK